MRCLLENCNVLTMDEQKPIAQRVGIRGGKIVLLGDEKKTFTGKTIDLEGKTVVPGLIDTHVHFMDTGLTAEAVDLSGAMSAQDILDKLNEEAKGGRQIYGYGFHPNKLDCYPTKKELDEVSKDVPIRISQVDGHLSIVNSKAFNLIGLDGMEGVEYKDGKPTGVLRKKANDLASEWFKKQIPQQTKINALHAAAKKALGAGITTVHCMEGSLRELQDVELMLEYRNQLPLRTVIYPQYGDAQRIKKINLRRIGGCISIDGSLSSHTAALFEPYSDKETKGELYFSDKWLSQFIAHAKHNTLQVALHAIGDRAIRKVISAYSKGAPGYRIEHCLVPKEEDIHKISQLGIAVATQPSFLATWGGENGMYKSRLGDRFKRIIPLRELIDEGVLVAGGSDAPITQMNPLLGIHMAVNHPVARNQISVEEALKLFTINASRISGHNGGKLVEGAPADLVVLTDNPCEKPESINKIKVEATLLGGEVVYRRSTLY